MIRISVLVFFVFSCLLIPKAHSMSLYQLLENAVEEHNLIQAAEAGRQSAIQGVRQTRGEWYPHVSASANIGQEHIDPASSRSASSKTRNHQTLRASQLIYDFGRSGAGIDRSLAVLNRSEVELLATRQDVMLQGISAYLDVYRFARRLELARQSEKRIVDLTGVEETLVTRGAGLASDVLQAKSQLAAARATRVRAEGQLINARSRFKAVFGLDLTDEQVGRMNRPARPLDYLPATIHEALQAASEKSLDMHLAEHNIDIADHEIRFRQARYLPEVHLIGELKRKQNDSGISGTRNEALGMVEVTWDIFSGGKERAAVMQAIHNRQEMERVRDDQEYLVQERVVTAWQNLITSRETARFLKDQAEILEEFLELAMRERMLGTRSLLDVLNGEVTYLAALSNSISAEIDQDLAMYSMLYTMGTLELDVLR